MSSLQLFSCCRAVSSLKGCARMHSCSLQSMHSFWCCKRALGCQGEIICCAGVLTSTVTCLAPTW